MIVIRRGDRLDVAFLRSLLVHAYNWHVTVFETEIPHTRYLDNWGRPGDAALIAMDGGHSVGAAWYRRFRASAPGYGFVDEQTPELTVVVVPSRQGEGIGQELIAAVVRRAKADGHPGLSVSTVRDTKECAVYSELGFEQVAEHGAMLTLRHELAGL